MSQFLIIDCAKVYLSWFWSLFVQNEIHNNFEGVFSRVDNIEISISEYYHKINTE